MLHAVSQSFSQPVSQLVNQSLSRLVIQSVKFTETVMGWPYV
jgi:hypothetical protein